MAFLFFAIIRQRLEAIYLDSGEIGPLVAVEPKAQFAALFGVMEDGEVEGSRVVEGVPILAPGEDVARALR